MLFSKLLSVIGSGVIPPPGGEGLYTWGDNSAGCLGVLDQSNVQSVRIGENLYSWGDNSAGCLGVFDPATVNEV